MVAAHVEARSSVEEVRRSGIIELLGRQGPATQFGEAVAVQSSGATPAHRERR
jgi:hypothetical protein